VTFRSSDPSDAPRQVEATLSDRALATTYGAKGRSFAESRSWDVLMAQLLKHYAKALDLNGLSSSKP
jgi:hypothetical protein